jgi:hypothetical protein
MESTVNRAKCFSVLGEIVIDSTVIQTEINLCHRFCLLPKIPFAGRSISGGRFYLPRAIRIWGRFICKPWATVTLGYSVHSGSIWVVEF